MERCTHHASWMVLLLVIAAQSAGAWELSGEFGFVGHGSVAAATPLAVSDDPDDSWRLDAQVEPGLLPGDIPLLGMLRPATYSAGLHYLAAPAVRLSASYGAQQQGMFSVDPRANGPAMSAVFRRPVGVSAFAATATWGRSTRDGAVTDRFLLEGRYTSRSHHQFFARAANVTPLGDDPAAEVRLHPVTAGTLGYVYATRQGSQHVGVGLSITAFKVPPDLQEAYGARPLAYQLYLRVGFSPQG